MAKIIISYGHRNLTGGNPVERERTDDIGDAIRDRLRAAGHQVWVVQEHDGDANPTMTLQPLDAVGRVAVALDRRHGPVNLFLSVHLEGGGPNVGPGAFAIVPDDPTRRSADTWANNPLDVAFARKVSRAVAESTGVGLRATTEPGVMSERATGVGGQDFRLSEFRETVPMRAHAARIILECGNLSRQQAAIMASGFPAKVAAGVVKAVNAQWGAADKPAPAPAPKPAPDPASPPILGGHSASQAQARRYLQAGATGGYTDTDVAWIVRYYFDACDLVGVDAAVAIAQMAHETGKLTSAWSQRPNRNPAGLGVTGDPGAGLKFASWPDAVTAHVGRMAAYALPEGQGSATQRMFVREALRLRPLPDRLRGSAKTIAGLTGTWATDKAYHDGVLRHLKALKAA